MSHLNTKLARYKSFFPFQDGVSWDSSATCIRGEIGIGDSDSYAGVDIQIGAFIIRAHGVFLSFYSHINHINNQLQTVPDKSGLIYYKSPDLPVVTFLLC